MTDRELSAEELEAAKQAAAYRVSSLAAHTVRLVNAYEHVIAERDQLRTKLETARAAMWRVAHDLLRLQPADMALSIAITHATEDLGIALGVPADDAGLAWPESLTAIDADPETAD